MLWSARVAALTVVTLAAGTPDSREPSAAWQLAVGAQSETLADGKRLYEANCATCHGPHAQGAVKAGTEISIIAERGGKQPPDLTDEAWITVQPMRRSSRPSSRAFPWE